MTRVLEELQKQKLRRMEGRVILITGGGGGIARGIARAFAGEGAKLILTDLFPEGMEKTKKEVERDFDCEVVAIVADGSKEEEVIRVIEEGVAHFGRLDGVINNAQASASGKLLVEHSTKDFDKAVYSGLYGTFYYMKYAFPYLCETKGSVVNFASGAGLTGKVGQSSYAAAKEGIRGLTRVAATEWGAYGINVNVVCPLVLTDALIHWKEENPEIFARTLEAIPLGKYGDAENDIGKICVFLCSFDASYMSGETIHVQGGSGLRP
ncbi:MAG: SDR family oxidoreductase [Acetivibrio sp.]